MAIQSKHTLGNLILQEYHKTFPDIVKNSPKLPNVNERFDNIISAAIGDKFHETTKINFVCTTSGAQLSGTPTVTLVTITPPNENFPQVKAALFSAKIALKVNLAQKSEIDKFLTIFVKAFYNFLLQLPRTIPTSNLTSSPTFVGAGTGVLTLNPANMASIVENYLLSLGITKYDKNGKALNKLPDFLKTLIAQIINIYSVMVSNTITTISVSGPTNPTVTGSAPFSGYLAYPI